MAFDAVFTQDETDFIMDNYQRQKFRGTWWTNLPWRPALFDEVLYVLWDKGMRSTPYVTQAERDRLFNSCADAVPGVLVTAGEARDAYRETHEELADMLPNDGKTRRWDDAEVRALREYYPEHGPKWEGWTELLNPVHRCSRVISKKASSIGVAFEGRKGGRGVAWTDEEKALIRENYPRTGAAYAEWWELLQPSHRASTKLGKFANTIGVHFDYKLARKR